MRAYNWRWMGVATVLAATGAGCTIDVGPGQIAPLELREQVDLSQADGVAAPEGQISFSTHEDIEFLSQDESTRLDKQYGGKLKAVDAIDVRLENLVVERADDGTVPAGMVLDISLDGVALPVGQRVRLPEVWIGRLRNAVHAHETLTGPLSYTLTVGPADARATLNARATVQPFIVVDIADAL
jgi:hypothetical protein